MAEHPSLGPGRSWTPGTFPISPPSGTTQALLGICFVQSKCNCTKLYTSLKLPLLWWRISLLSCTGCSFFIGLENVASCRIAPIGLLLPLCWTLPSSVDIHQANPFPLQLCSAKQIAVPFPHSSWFFPQLASRRESAKGGVSLLPKSATACDFLDYEDGPLLSYHEPHILCCHCDTLLSKEWCVDDAPTSHWWYTDIRMLLHG